MKKTILLITVVIIVLHVSASSNSEAKKIFESCKQKMSFKNVSMILDLETFDKRGNKKTKEMTVSFAEFDRQKKVLIEFTSPELITGTKIVTTDYSNQKGIIEIYSPATGRVQKIKANQHNLKIMGSKIPISQFSWLDESGFSFTSLGNEQFNGVNCHKIKIEKSGEKEYTIAFISAVNEYLLRIQKYDRNGQIISITELSDYFNVNGASKKVYPQKISIANIKTGEKTNMEVHEVNILSKVSIDDFTLEATNL
ncbi:MAG: outer membrane lipoprotein-sorting protein [Draconibacterium sp.]|nr:outer membrane lipoprotein-sorting protein [Draconibacterium sp.]